MHSIKHNRLEAAVLFAIQYQVNTAVSYSELIAEIYAASIGYDPKACARRNVLFIISGIAGCITVCNGESISTPSSTNDHSYRDVSQAEGVEGALYSLGIICVVGVGLLLTQRRNSFKDHTEP